MLNRRDFLRGAGAAAFGSLAAGSLFQGHAAQTASPPIRNHSPNRALILWYSQTGHTARMGNLMAKVLEAEGLEVKTCSLTETDPSTATQYDLLMIGSPVHYTDLPPNVEAWLKRMPAVTGTAAASWVTYGNKGSNQVNTCCRLLELLVAKGAAPVGMATFGNMNTFAPYLSLDPDNRVLHYRHLPNEQTYEQGRQYARQVLDRVHNGQTVAVERKFSLAGLVGVVNLQWWSKRLIDKHIINREKCVDCGLCARKCPVGAIDLVNYRIDTDSCLLCMGCINNCPAEAVEMVFGGRRVVGFVTFCREHNIVITEPPELAGAPVSARREAGHLFSTARDSVLYRLRT